MTPVVLVLRFLAAWLLVQPSMAYVEMTWNTSHFFGPDGPWQAITLGVQNNRTTEIRTINLLPADNLGYTYIPTADLCALPDANEYCGIGGMMDYPSSFTNTTHWSNRDDFYVSGTVSTVMVNSGTQRASDVTVIAMTDETNTHIKYPTGDVPGAEIGFFYKGGSGSDLLCPETGCDFTRSLYNAGQISSMSYGMQIGSVSLGQRGSLVLGGYDRSRIAGSFLEAIPGSMNAYNTMDPNSFRLQDISIGVEIGGTPFTFTYKTGLLSGDNGTSSQPLPVILDSSTAYIGLPQEAASALASSLPVTLHQETGYYLWNTADPSYNKITTSVAYLGFTFSGASSSSPSNTTIKVPFRLLNLTLGPRASGLENAVPYFPIRVLERSDYEFYTFGRAFLQAAFIVEDFGQNSTWMAQAPGPGAREAEIVDFEEFTRMATGDFDETVFADSWANNWRPLSKDESNSDGEGSLGGGAIAGIVVGVLAAVALVLFGVIIYLRRRRQRDQQSPLEIMLEEKTEPVELHGTTTRAEIEGSERFEAAAKLDKSQEPASPQELPGSLLR